MLFMLLAMVFDDNYIDAVPVDLEEGAAYYDAAL